MSLKSLKDALKGVLNDEDLGKVAKSYDFVGDILLVKIHPDLLHRSEKLLEIGKALKKAFPRAKTVAAVPIFSKTQEIFRTRDLKVLFTEKDAKESGKCTETLHKESGCVFKVDLRHTFFSPRLAYERMRVAKKVKAGEIVVNMFAGVGCFSILIAKVQPKVRKVYSIDINPVAVAYMRENIRLNKVEGKVVPILGDAHEVLSDFEGVSSRVLMPLPESSHEFLADAVRALNLHEGGVIHYYTVASGEKDVFKEPFERALRIIRGISPEISVEVEEKRIVRSVAPRKWHVVFDLKLRKSK